jgi:DNA-binding transcriptional MocR family regulator
MSTIQTTQLNIPADVIDFGVGQPSPALLPLETMRQAAAHRLSQPEAALLAYGAEQGDGYFRLALAQFLSEGYGLPVEAEHLFITASASMGLDLICTLFARSGDTIFVEEPSYFLALRILADHHFKVVSLPTDGEGLIVEAVEEELKRHKPAFLYTIPAFHNPSSVTLSAARRERLVRLSEEHNFLIVADEVYQLLAYTITPPPPVSSFDQAGTVLSLGSFSKIMAPGLRLGWIQAKPALIKRFVLCGLLDSGGGLNPFTSGIIRSALELGWQQQQLNHLKTVYRRRAACLSTALRQHLPANITFAEPQGGFFIWLRFPETVDTEALLPALQAKQVSINPGIRFSSRQELRNYARLSFAYYDEAELEEGVRRLAKAADRGWRIEDRG